MTKNITIVRGDDTNFFNQTLLVVSFKTVLNLDGYKLRLTVENPTNIMKQFEIHNNTAEINFGKIDSSTFGVGKHKANLKLIDTLGRVKTMYLLDINVEDEFNASVDLLNEYEIEIELDTDGISKYKNYNELHNKPSINDVELVGNKSLVELGIQPSGDYSTYEYVNDKFNFVDTILDSKANISDIPTKVSQLVNDKEYLTEHQDISNKADIDYVEELLSQKSDKNDTYTKVDVNTLLDDINNLKQDKLTAGNNIFIDENNVISASTVTSVNGMVGDVNLTIPSIEGLATEQQLAQGLNTKQDKGDYALKEEIPSLEGYVKNTDYATNGVGGVMMVAPYYGTSISSGYLVARNVGLSLYQNDMVKTSFVSKGTLENIKDDYVKRGITENQTELSEDEKTSAKNWLGYATPTDIMQAIASIPQFKLSIVDELPLAGEKMTLYLVPKEGTNNDVYDEYIWIEQTSSFEHLGTTAVDLTDYVKNTDYAGQGRAGVVKLSTNYGTNTNADYLSAEPLSLDKYLSSHSKIFISKGTLENVLAQYSKTVLTTEADYEALETKDANTLYLIEE